jgi:hypothetical protein
MKVGIGFPNAVRAVDRAGIVEWAQRAEWAGFASLGTLDRFVSANGERYGRAVLVSGGLDGSVRVWDLESGEPFLPRSQATRVPRTRWRSASGRVGP